MGVLEPWASSEGPVEQQNNSARGYQPIYLTPPKEGLYCKKESWASKKEGWEDEKGAVNHRVKALGSASEALRAVMGVCALNVRGCL